MQPKARLRTVLRENGAALVEMALSVSVLLLILIGAFEMCVAFYVYHATSEAARQGSRWAMVRGSASCTNTPSLSKCDAANTDIQSYVAGLGYLNLTTSDVTVSWLQSNGLQPVTFSSCTPPGCNLPGNEVQVTVTYPFNLSIPFLNSRSLNISSTSSMVVAQ
jgi:Flp pilus assembly protein TadG